MADYVDTRIVEGMYAYLREMSPEPLPTHRPNASFVPPKVVTPVGAEEKVGDPLPYLKISFLPARTTGYSVLHTGSNIHRGIMQVSVYWPRNKGMSEPTEVAGAIASHFKRGTRFSRDGTRISIISPPTIAAPLDEPTLLHIPVSIGYFVVTPN